MNGISNSEALTLWSLAQRLEACQGFSDMQSLREVESAAMDIVMFIRENKLESMRNLPKRICPDDISLDIDLDAIVGEDVY